MPHRIEEEILRALRRITRAIDLHSRHLVNTFGLTGPQLVCLRVIGRRGSIAPGELADEVSLSQATITGIIDRLVTRQLVSRDRTDEDRRKVILRVTPAGSALIAQAPSPLQEHFTSQLSALAPASQQGILEALNKIVSMMGSDGLDAAPVLTLSSTAMSRGESKDAVDAQPADVLPVPVVKAASFDDEKE